MLLEMVLVFQHLHFDELQKTFAGILIKLLVNISFVKMILKGGIIVHGLSVNVTTGGS